MKALKEVADVWLSWLTWWNALSIVVDVLVVSRRSCIVCIVARNNWNQHEVTASIDEFFMKQQQGKRPSREIYNRKDCAPNAAHAWEKRDDYHQIKEERREVYCSRLEEEIDEQFNLVWR